MWLVYGVYVHDVPVICANGGNAAAVFANFRIENSLPTVETIGDFPVKVHVLYRQHRLSAALSIGSTI